VIRRAAELQADSSARLEAGLSGEIESLLDQVEHDKLSWTSSRAEIVTNEAGCRGSALGPVLRLGDSVSRVEGMPDK